MEAGEAGAEVRQELLPPSTNNFQLEKPAENETANLCDGCHGSVLRNRSYEVTGLNNGLTTSRAWLGDRRTFQDFMVRRPSGGAIDVGYGSILARQRWETTT